LLKELLYLATPLTARESKRRNGMHFPEDYGPLAQRRNFCNQSGTSIPSIVKNIFARLAIACRDGANIACDRGKNTGRTFAPTGTTGRR